MSHLEQDYGLGWVQQSDEPTGTAVFDATGDQAAEIPRRELAGPVLVALGEPEGREEQDDGEEIEQQFHGERSPGLRIVPAPGFTSAGSQWRLN